MNIRPLRLRDLEPGEKFCLKRELSRPTVYKVLTKQGIYGNTASCTEVNTNRVWQLHESSYVIRID